jgi:hypothetical protein
MSDMVCCKYTVPHAQFAIFRLNYDVPRERVQFEGITGFLAVVVADLIMMARYVFLLRRKSGKISGVDRSPLFRVHVLYGRSKRVFWFLVILFLGSFSPFPVFFPFCTDGR